MIATLSNKANNSNEKTIPDPEVNTCAALVCGIGILFIVIFFATAGIRELTKITEEDFYWPCNNSEIISSSEVNILRKENAAYERIINEFEKLNSTELKNIKYKNSEVKLKIKRQNCYLQKCAKINIQKNMEEIKDKILSVSTWLFRIAALLCLLNGILCYYKRNIFGCGFGIFVFIFVAPIFINAFLSLYDFHEIQKFRIKC